MYNRDTVLDIMRGWLGATEGSAKQIEIVNTYNNWLPNRNTVYTRSTKMLTSYDWCACTVSAAIIKAGYADNKFFCPEISCGRLINSLIALGAWVEDESVTPEPGWLIFYDWDDNGVGDDVTGHDHVGIVESATNGKIITIEGNYNNKCQRRTIKVNARYIRGYGALKYGTSASTETVTPVKVSYASAKYKNIKLAGTYHTTTSINLRSSASPKSDLIAVLPKGTACKCYGYYNLNGVRKWYLVQATVDNSVYIGYAHSGYLK